MSPQHEWRGLLASRGDWLDLEASDEFHRATRFRCGRGWLPIIEDLLDEIEPSCGATGAKAMLFLMHIDPGGLHIVDGWLPDPDALAAVRDACDRAAARTRVTCETCGAPGRPGNGKDFQRSAATGTPATDGRISMADGTEDEGRPWRAILREHADWIEAGHPRSPFPMFGFEVGPAGPASSASSSTTSRGSCGPRAGAS